MRNGNIGNSDAIVLYEGHKSHLETYGLCYLCKEPLETVHDEANEGWYFVNTKQVRFKTTANANAQNISSLA